ncbi:hypothetical protein TIFTF001_032095 [Ficus carica]|uniref:Uncharacterized protein n=1 Tax=Ficus carica TaxID=3494 RepID=A0AA88J1Z6_FICCA|nr:hypothetical protein TIFTF001_032095 [Ficus carica]
MKTKSKNKTTRSKGNNLFMCFRPVGVLEPDGSGREGDPVLAYIAVQRKKESVAVFPKASPANDTVAVPSEEKEEDFHGKKISGSRRLSDVLKAVFFEVSLARKIKKVRSNKKTPSKFLSESARYDYHNSTNKDDFEFDFDFGQRISHSVSALATSSSTLSATNSNSLCPSCPSSSVTKTTPFRSTSTRSRKTQENVHHQYSQKDCGLLLMLISLLVLVFWGKICAIFCTSTWLFFMPRGIKYHDRIESPPPAENSSEFKRKIVMEGLLARERGSYRCPILE